ncbi:type II toxin-antitoxin system VapC family toxin [Allostreptomyces psammosilenae]|uniref:Ribonuclease VapC n=1 Tax=Allostreptomyces psammosilenae TaxID=1892865 RepID=A0A853A3Z8_9ACTN|nr:type II toxin-antitoxin system VapC family toxin [Allostreptomyces psammosilenae]NYI05431.1 hypothetical protein [Allostreptomyces psammosilenae]
MIYLDSCALVKLLVREPETPALEEWLRRAAGTPLVTSVLAEVELARVLTREAPAALAALPAVLAKIDRYEISATVRARAASYPLAHLRSLDAIHLATADLRRSDLVAFVTYDKRLADAAVSIGLSTTAPA